MVPASAWSDTCRLGDHHGTGEIFVATSTGMRLGPDDRTVDMPVITGRGLRRPHTPASVHNGTATQVREAE